MNYGKFFRLNKNLSRIEEGFAVYDYTDLPAYFARSLDNLMSPKYPVSMTVMADSVVFKLHYSAFKIAETPDEPANFADSKRNQYLYDIEIIEKLNNGGGNLINADATTKIVHMEETILELPYTDTVGRNLSDTIRGIYNTYFPLIDTQKNDSSGGRFLHDLIRKRYLEENTEEEKDKHNNFYRSLRRISDGTPSYSTLWLMGLVKGEKDKVRYVRTDKKGNIVGFLRKLLLDFMFDLKHSDVFQNSSQFQKMYSGLMSNFYFSALMHKCEYYYYRKQIRQAIGTGSLSAIDKKRITKLYAEELFRAEDLWVKDIMSPHAEEYFEYYNNSSHKYIREITEEYDFNRWPSWFAEPEEEMRRVCFTMREKNEKKEWHICNSDVLVSLLDIGENNIENKSVETNMVELRNKNKSLISQWFLKRYDFNDVYHLHLYKHANITLFLALGCLFILLFAGISIKVILLLVLGVVSFVSLLRLINLNNRNSANKPPLPKERSLIVRKKIARSANIAFASLAIVLMGIFWKECVDKILAMYNKATAALPHCFIVLACIMVMAVLYSLFPELKVCLHKLWRWCRAFPSQFEPRLLNMMSNLHLLLPRLIASIVAAWLTMTMGFDLILSFFSEKPSIPTISVLVMILLVFVMYEVNRVTPRSNAWMKLYRSVELIFLSYAISLIIGLVVINFLGEKFLERGGFVGDGEFYTQYIDNSKRFLYEGKKENSNKEDNKITLATINDSISYIISQIDGIKNKLDEQKIFRKEIEKLDSIYHASGSAFCSYPLVEHFDFFGKDVFVLRDFLIMFSFIAMFIGIFIQLIIFGDNKQMTEL